MFFDLRVLSLPQEAMSAGWRGMAACVGMFLAAAGQGEIVLKPGDAGTNQTPGIVVPQPDGAVPEKVYDTMIFLNGDKLRGTFFSIDEDGRVRWKNPYIDEVLRIDPAGLEAIDLNRPSGTNDYPGHSCLVRCLNEDELMGQLVGMDTNDLILKTWYAGTLRIPREWARSIVPGQSQSTAIFEGPASLEEWTIEGNRDMRVAGRTVESGWEYRQGALIGLGSTSIGRELELTPSLSVEFDLAWQGYLQMGVSFYTDKLERYGGDCYMLQMGSGSVYLQRVTKDRNSSNLGHAQADALRQKGNARIRILANAEQKNVTFLIDGEMVKQWTDRSDFPVGKGLVFYQQGQGRVKISRIRVTEWDGKLESSVKPSGATDRDLVKLGNNDQISGELKTIRDGKVQFGTEFATMEIPLDRVAEIEMAGPARAEAADAPEAEGKDDGEKSGPMVSRPEGAVRVIFADQGFVTLALSSWNDQRVAAFSPTFGEAKFIPTAFSRIEFNLDRDRSAADDFGLFGGFE